MGLELATGVVMDRGVTSARWVRPRSAEQRGLLVAVADPDTIVRAALARVVGEIPGAQLVAEVRTGREVLGLAVSAIDVLVTEVGLPELDGLEAATRLRQLSPALQVVVLTGQADGQSRQRAQAAGVFAYLSKTQPPEELQRVLEAVRSGERSGELAGTAAAGSRGGTPAPEGLESLSAREREVLQLVGEGLASKEIAADLNLSVKTVDAHRRNVMQKLNIRTVAGLTRFCVREGLVRIDHRNDSGVPPVYQVSSESDPKKNAL